MTERSTGRARDRGSRPAEVSGSGGDEFTLYDLRVEVVACRGEMVCNHRIGDSFELSGENLSLPPGQTFPVYPLAALLPLLPAKQRPTHPNDWMTTDTDVACPDPNCGAVFRITRVRERVFRHADVTVVPLPERSDPADESGTDGWARRAEAQEPSSSRGPSETAGGTGGPETA